MTILYGIIMTGVLYYASSSIIELAEIQMLSGINMYQKDPEWRLLLDRIQYEEQCCGAQNYKDWLQNLNDNDHNFETDTEISLRDRNSLDLSKVPYSCAKKAEEKVLFRFQNITNRFHSNKNNLNKNDQSYGNEINNSNEDDRYNNNDDDEFNSNLQKINTQGCLKSLYNIFRKLILYLFVVLGLASFLQSVLLFLIKLLLKRTKHIGSKKKDNDDENLPVIKIHYPKDRVHCLAIPIEYTNSITSESSISSSNSTTKYLKETTKHIMDEVVENAISKEESQILKCSDDESSFTIGRYRHTVYKYENEPPYIVH